VADIRSFPGLRHLRGTPTAYVRHLRRERLAHEGTALSSWFRPLTAALSEVPVDDRELPLHFHARTVDYQDGSATTRAGTPASWSSTRPRWPRR
jgi:hypothetical protein